MMTEFAPIARVEVQLDPPQLVESMIDRERFLKPFYDRHLQSIGALQLNVRVPDFPAPRNDHGANTFIATTKPMVEADKPDRIA